MTPPFTVRDLRPEDHDELASVTAAAYLALLGPDLDPGYVAELADVTGRAALLDVLVAVDGGGRILGGIAYLPDPGPLTWFEGDDEAGLRMLAVAPEAQGQGVGAALVATCVDRARAAGKRRLLLHTTTPMTAAHRLYERAGFHRDPDRDRVLDGGLLLLAYALDLDPER